MSENETLQSTTTYIAKPADDRCHWWSAIITNEFLDTKYLNEKPNFKYLKRGTDLELEEGTFIIDSEANHHRNSRGYTVCLGIVLNGMVKWISPSIEMKMLIKKEGHQDLMKGSGDITGCIRLALYLLRQESLLEGFIKLKESNKKDD